jgi:ABC-type amino acid transport substrate-binding protein
MRTTALAALAGLTLALPAAAQTSPEPAAQKPKLIVAIAVDSSPPISSRNIARTSRRSEAP